MRIAIIGTGISGLTAAYLLNRKHHITIFEKNDYIGGHTHWRKNFMSVLPEVRSLGFSDAFINMWEFYFCYCEAGFIERNIGDYQVVFAKSGARDIEINY